MSPARRKKSSRGFGSWLGLIVVLLAITAAWYFFYGTTDPSLPTPGRANPSKARPVAKPRATASKPQRNAPAVKEHLVDEDREALDAIIQQRTTP